MRIAEAIAETLYNARLHLAGSWDFDAIQILFTAECAVRLENSQN